MTPRLQIAHLATRIRPPDADAGRFWSDQVDRSLAGPLPAAMEQATERALARAGLPADTFVAVRDVSLRLIPRDGVDADDLAEGWAQALEDALVLALGAGVAGSVQGGGHLAVFADRWAAEAACLWALADGEPPWWAAALSDARSPGGPPAVVSVLDGWLQRDPARTLVQMAELIRARPALAGLLAPAEADDLTRAILDRIVGGAGSGGAGIDVHLHHPPVPSASRVAADLMRRCDRLRPGQDAGISPRRRIPWVLAMLLAESPSAARLPAQTLLDVVAEVLAAMDRPESPLSVASPEAAGPEGLESVATQTPESWASSASAPRIEPHPLAPGAIAIAGAQPARVAEPVETMAGGLLLLLRPLIRLDLLPAGPAAAQALGDLGLTALRRVLAPLPPGAAAVAAERERSLLEVFAPECDWRRPIRGIPVAGHESDAVLHRLIAECPAGIASAPGIHRVYGSTTPPLVDELDQRLARLLLRPGVLVVDPWSVELVWPLGAVDLALRRAGWDQDPGWVPWLGRVIRFRFGDPS